MTIGYSTKWPKSMGPEYAGKPNHFVEKIWAGLIDKIEDIRISHYEEYTNAHQYQFDCDMSEYEDIFINPKYHTFRQDPKDRWKVGMKIHPVINNRTKDRFQFAPVLEVKSIQKIEILHNTIITGIGALKKVKGNGVNAIILIDGLIYTGYGTEMYGYEESMKQLTLNDGFESVDQFFAWFNKDFSGKIIHWTNLKY